MSYQGIVSTVSLPLVVFLLIAPPGIMTVHGQTDIPSGPRSCGDLTDHLAGYWPLDTIIDGRVADYSSHGHNGDVTGISTTHSGRHSNSLMFDGHGDFVSLPPADRLRPQLPISVSLWAKFNTLPSEADHHMRLISWSIKDRRTSWHIWTVKGSDRIQALFGDGEDFHRLKWDKSVAKEEWIHIGVVRSREGGRLYINGKLVDGDNDSLTLPDKFFREVWLGGWANRGHYFNGFLDDVRIYNDKLTRAELEKLADGDCNEG